MMRRSVALRHVVTLMTLALVVVNAEVESREWTPPFPWATRISRQTMTSSTTLPTTRSLTTQIKAFKFSKSVCEGPCCVCTQNKTDIKCSASTTCKELIVGSDNDENRFPRQAKNIFIERFQKLKIRKQSLMGLDDLTILKIEKIDAIEIEGNGLSRPLCARSSTLHIKSRPNIIISASSFDLTSRTFTGDWNEITIINSTLRLIQTESFYQISCLKKLTIENNLITEIESKTFHHGHSQYLSVKNNTVETIKNNAFHFSRIDYDAIITLNRVNNIQSEAFALQSVRTFHFHNNTVGAVYLHAFQLFVTEEIIIKFNSFENVARRAFYNIRTTNQTKMTLVLSLKQFERAALDLSESLSVSVLHLVDVRLDFNCECDLDVQLNFLFSQTSTESSKNVSSIPNIIRDSVSCNSDIGLEKFDRYKHKYQCHETNATLIGSIVTALLLLIILMGVAVAVRQWTNFRRTASMKTQNSIVMRVYTEAECKVDEEYALPLEVLNEHG